MVHWLSRKFYPTFNFDTQLSVCGVLPCYHFLIRCKCGHINQFFGYFAINISSDSYLPVRRRQRGCRQRPRRRGPSCRRLGEWDPWRSWTWRWGWGWWWRTAPSFRAQCRSAPRRTLKQHLELSDQITDADVKILEGPSSINDIRMGGGFGQKKMK